MPAPIWKRSEIWGIAIALITLLLVLLVVSRDWSFFMTARAQARLDRSTLNLLSEVFSDVQDLETGERGFLLVGALPYLAPYQAATADLKSQVARLEAMTAGDPVQHQRVQRIADLIEQKIAGLQRTIDLRRQAGFQAARAVIQTGQGKELMDQIRAETAGFRHEADDRLKQSEEQTERYRLRAASTAVGGSGLLFVLLAAAAVVIRNRSEAREQALASLAASKREAERGRDLIETTLRSIGDAVITTDAAGNITFLNPVAHDLTGCGLSCIGRPIEEVFRIINEFTRERVENPIDKVRRTGMVAGLANHTLLLARDGREIAIDDSGAPIRDGYGGTVGFVLVFRDIGERRATENALRRSEARFRTVANAAPVLLWLAGPNGAVGFLNRQWAEFTGRNAEEDVHSGWERAVHPEDLPGFLEARRVALEQGVRYFSECRLRRADGEYRSVVCAEAPRFTSEGVMDGFVAAWFDVTDLKQVQRSLEISEGRFRSLVEGTTSIVWQADATGSMIAPLPGWERFTGQTFSQYRGLGWIEAMHPEDRQRVTAAWREAVRSGQRFLVEFRLWNQGSKDYRYVVSRGVPLKSPEGEVVEWLGAVTDITEQRQFEERLGQAAKLESLGVLAGGIAHDFNNLLTGILGNASLLEMMLRDPEERAVAQQIAEAGQRAAGLTQQMLAYSGKGRFVIESANLGDEIRQILPLIRSSIPKHVQVAMDLKDGLPPVDIDRSQFQQLLMNLVINGAEAIDGSSGGVTVTVLMEDLDAGAIAQRFADEQLAPGRYVVLEVRDTGMGMDAATRAKIFDPFFTTKFTGRGLGLAAAIGIVRGHKGAIEVDSAPGSGSVFRIYLPAAAAPPPSERHEVSSVSGREAATVLVVDDEEVVRILAGRALAGHGFEVLLAANGQEAIEMLEAHRDSISAIVLDISMPVLGGEDALPRLREIKPSVCIVVSSGYSQVEAERRFGGSVDGFVQKPYSVQRMVSVLRQALRKLSDPAAA